MPGTELCGAHSGHTRGVPSERELLMMVTRAAKDGEWRAATWLLTRLYPVSKILPAPGVGAPVPAGLSFDEGSDPFAEVDELAERRRG